MRCARLWPAVAAFVTLVSLAGCRRPSPPPGEPVIDALKAEEREVGLTYAESLGRPAFAQYCATCHGDAGKGDGQNASNLTPPAPDFAASKTMADAAYVRRVIVQGSAAVGRSPLSPPWGRTLTAQQVEYLVLYCQALAKKK
jgi:mono/diheme cytochrome c family protein